MYFQLFTGGYARTRLTPLCRVPIPKALIYRTPVLKWILCVQTCNLYGLSVRRGDEELFAVAEAMRFRSNERGFLMGYPCFGLQKSCCSGTGGHS